MNDTASPPPTAGPQTAASRRRTSNDAGVTRALVLIAALVAVVFFVLQALSRAWFNDDAFITFRYAEHLAAGDGFVWNRGGPPVEGSTSLGWTLCLALGMRLGIDPLRTAHALGLFSGALSLLVVWWWGQRRRWNPLATLGALAFLVLQQQWVLWSVSAMETTAAAFLLLLATLRLLQESGRWPDGTGARRTDSGWAADAPTAVAPRGAGVGSGLLFAAASVFRPEAPLLHLSAGIGAWWMTRRAVPPRFVLVSGAVHAVAWIGLTTWRLVTFGQPLPNPFYVKVGGLQIQRGLVWWLEFLQQNHLGIVVLLLLVALRWTLRRRPAAIPLLLQSIAWTAWVVGIGGGRWEFRWMVPLLPLVAVWVGMTLQSVLDAAGPGRGHALAAALAVAVAITQGMAYRTPFRPFGDVLSSGQLMQSVQIMGTEAASLGRYLGPDDTVCLGWAGVFPYVTRVRHVDPWGLNDPEIARRPFDASGTVFHQRHATWDDLVARNVLITDAFNHFLFPRPYDGRRLRVVPWVRPGVEIHSVALPEGHYWLFASPRPRADVESWLQTRGLTIERSVPLPAGLPRIGVDTDN